MLTPLHQKGMGFPSFKRKPSDMQSGKMSVYNVEVCVINPEQARVYDGVLRLTFNHVCVEFDGKRCEYATDCNPMASKADGGVLQISDGEHLELYFKNKKVLYGGVKDDIVVSKELFDTWMKGDVRQVGWAVFERMLLCKKIG